MYHECKLVHADLSEYNIIYHDNHLYVIDVSQSVEHDHPHAFDFLRADIKNIEDYFGRHGVHCLGLRRCFEFVTREKLSCNGDDDDDEQQVLNRWLTESAENPTISVVPDGDGAGADYEDSVFMKSYIPRTLNDVYDPERDAAAAQQGTSAIYSGTIGIVDPKAKVHFADGEEEAGEELSDTEGEDGDSDADGSDEEDTEFKERKPRGHRHEDRESKKVYPVGSF
jgi:RIO kinase 1